MERATNDFIEANRDTIKCLALNAADAAFSAAAAIRTVGEDAPLSLWFVYDAIVASASVLSCAAPPREFFEETFEGENKKCQCAEVGGQLFLEWLDAAGNRTKLSNSELVEAKEIKDSGVTDGVATCHWITVDGAEKTSTYDLDGGSTPLWYIVPTLDTECCKGTPTPIPVQPYPAPYSIPGEGGTACPNQVSLIDSCVDRYGFSQNFYKVKEFYDNCNEKSNYFYWESIAGPYVYYAFHNGFEGLNSVPPYAPPHPHAAPPVVQGVGNCNPGLSPVQYHLDVGCTYNPDTDDFDKKYTYDVEGTQEGILGLSRRMDALAWMINNAQLIPYTACKDEKPVLEGEWRTISFRSDSVSPYGKSRLCKRFRYRGQQGFGLGEVVEHWKDFSFQSGPVIVQHAGSSWGTPQVWASTADEGKRVIRHAAGEAGIDPDQDGRWVISSSNSARYGVSDTMRVDTKGGYYWITARDGSDQRPLVAEL